MLNVCVGILIAATPLEEQLDGAEIGDAVQYIAFQSGGTYLAERSDPKAKSVAKGTWKVDGNRVEVKVASCKGPACDEMGKPFAADVTLVAERAMTVKSDPPQGPLSSGSYYCRFQGCEKRTGVEIVTYGAKPVTMRYLVDFLIDKNRARDVTVVWWGKKIGKPAGASAITWCKRDEERGKKGAEIVAKDLAELPWIGKLEPVAGDTDCLYDVRVTVGDTVSVPPKR